MAISFTARVDSTLYAIKCVEHAINCVRREREAVFLDELRRILVERSYIRCVISAINTSNSYYYYFLFLSFST